MKAIDLKDLPPAAQKQARQRMALPRQRRGLSKEDVRRHAIRVLAAIDNLTQADRTRVLKHALTVNDV